MGKEPENWNASVQFENLVDFGLKAEEVDIATTFTPVLRLRTGLTRYSFTNETSLTLRDVISLGSLIKSNFQEDRWEYEAFWESAQRVREDKQKEAVERERRQLERQLQRQREQEERERKEQLQKEAAGRERYEQLEVLAEKSSSTSVTPERLEGISNHLYEGETVGFILWGGQRGTVLYTPDGEVELVQTGQQNWTAITSERILFSADERINQISYEILETARIGRFPRQSVDEWNTEFTQDSPALIVAGGEFVYVFEASAFTFPHLHDLAEEVREYLRESRQETTT